MEGAALAAEREDELRFLVAHQNAAWTGAAYAGKLKPFSEYRQREAGQQQQSNEEMLSTLFALKDMGAPMTIEEIN